MIINWENCLQIILNGCFKKYWHKVGLFNIHCGSTFKWLLFIGWLLFQLYIEKINFPCMCMKRYCERDIFQVNYYRPWSLKESKGSSGCKGPIGWITLLTAFKSINILSFLNFFLFFSFFLSFSLFFFLQKSQGMLGRVL